MKTYFILISLATIMYGQECIKDSSGFCVTCSSSGLIIQSDGATCGNQCDYNVGEKIVGDKNYGANRCLTSCPEGALDGNFFCCPESCGQCDTSGFCSHCKDTIPNAIYGSNYRVFQDPPIVANFPTFCTEKCDEQNMYKIFVVDRIYCSYGGCPTGTKIIEGNKCVHKSCKKYHPSTFDCIECEADTPYFAYQTTDYKRFDYCTDCPFGVKYITKGCHQVCLPNKVGCPLGTAPNMDLWCPSEFTEDSCTKDVHFDGETTEDDTKVKGYIESSSQNDSSSLRVGVVILLITSFIN